jgi:signal transduction histidine kinase
MALYYVVWLTATGLALACAWFFYLFLRRREAFFSSALRLLASPLEAEDFTGQARALCEVCTAEIGATGCSLYLQPGEQESGFRRAATAGRPAEETGPGLVRDLLAQAWQNGKPAEAHQGGRWLLALPVWPGHSGGGALLVMWEGHRRPGPVERSLLEVASQAAALIAPRFAREGALARAREEIETLQAEVAEESHLAGVGRLAAGVAHELNTPLGAVLTMVSSLQRTQTDQDVSRRLNIIRDAVERCKAIIEKLLVYSRGPVETEHGLTFSRFVRSTVNLNRVVENCVELLREDLGRNNIQVDLDLQPDLPQVRANTTQWSHVFSNLLINARDALKKAQVAEPRIEIKSRANNGRIVFEVSDNGPGIPADIQPKIFQPFFTTKDIGQGTGLGLAIVHEVVRKHQGTVGVRSTPGQGATFTIQVPLKKDEA